MNGNNPLQRQHSGIPKKSTKPTKKVEAVGCEDKGEGASNSEHQV